MIIIERFEGEFAVLENANTGEFVEVNKKELPPSAKEGDILELCDGKYIVDKEKTADRRRSVIDRLRKMGL